MKEISPEHLKEIAEWIVLSHTSDIEYLSIVEMSEEELNMKDIPFEDQDKIFKKIYQLVHTAKVTVEFPEEL